MSSNTNGEWQECCKILPYRDYLGRLILVPEYTQRRRWLVDGKLTTWEYRERPEAYDEWRTRQW